MEEFLRAYAPVTMARLVKEDMHWHGVDMKADDWILLSFPAANRDPAQFDRAGEVVIDRQVNRHAAFGLGIHRCLGSHLARMELRVALEVWLERVPEFSLADPDAVKWAAGQVRGPRTLPLRIGCKSGPASGEPLDVIATVRAFREAHDQQGLGPARSALGDSVWIEVAGIDVVLNSTRTQVFAPDAFTGLGIDLKDKRIVALKSSWHFHAQFSKIADRIVAVATPGAIQMDFAAIDYRKKRDLDFFPRVADPLGVD